MLAAALHWQPAWPMPTAGAPMTETDDAHVGGAAFAHSPVWLKLCRVAGRCTYSCCSLLIILSNFSLSLFGSLSLRLSVD